MGGRRGSKKSAKSKGFNMVNGVRLALEEEEKYAVCLKVFGGGMCSVLCEDRETRTCVMRSKFRGRDRRNNMLGKGTWVLVGIRDWEGSAHGKAAKCDLLEVYSPQEKDTLAKTEERDLSALTGVKSDGISGDGEFDFVDEKTQRYRDMVDFASDSDEEEDDDVPDSKPGVSGSKRFVAATGDTIDIDDI